MWDVLGYPVSVCALFLVLVVLPIALFVKYLFWYDRQVRQGAIQIPDDDDDDDDSPFDSWWQFPPHP